MYSLKLDERIMELIDGEKFDAAEAELREAKLQASNAADHQALDHVLSLLVTLSSVKQPPDLSKAEAYCLERERVIGTGYAKAQYAMTLYWAMDAPDRAVAKAREAIAASRHEGDDKTVYQSFGLLGLALLDLHQDDEAIQVLDEIHKMVAERRRIVVGDETLFLERLRAQTKDLSTITMIQGLAKTLSPVCRDTAFKARLEKLTDA
jgi:tetratricopeptide (TPR) repeat protein